MMTKWWDVLDENDFDPIRDMEAFYAPAKAYAIKRWQPYGTFDRTEYASIATLVLVETAHSASGLNLSPQQFWSGVKSGIDWRIGRQRFEKWDNDAGKIGSYDGYASPSGDPLEPADVVTELRVRQSSNLLQAVLCDEIAIMPTALKIPVALRFFEGVSLRKIGGMVNASQKPPLNWITGTCRYLLYQANLAVMTHSIGLERVKLPTVLPTYADALRSSAEQYVADRYGTDLPTWLGWVQRCYQADVSYLLDIIDVGNGHLVQTGLRHDRIDYAADVDHLDTMTPPPVAVSDLKARTGWGYPRCTKALQAWRLRHGIDTPNGSTAVRLRREQAA